MIDWIAVKEASLPKGYTGGRIHWNPWVGEYRAHPSDNDLEALSKLPESKYQRIRDIIADNDQWAREDAALKRSMHHWKALDVVPVPAITMPAITAVDAKAAQKAEENPEYEAARKAMHETMQLDPKRVEKYRKKIDGLVADLRAHAAKTARDTSPRYTDRLRRNAEFFMEMRNRKGIWDVIDINGNPGKVNGVGLLHN